MTYRPRSARGRTHTSHDVLHEGLPVWLLEPARAWLRPSLTYRIRRGSIANSGWTTTYCIDWIRTMVTRLHFTYAMPWDQPPSTVVDWVLAYMDHEGGEVGLDILDYVTHHLSFSRKGPADAEALSRILQEGGSAWEVTWVPGEEDEVFALTRRELGPVAVAIEAVRPMSERAGAHLADAWRHLAGRDPVPDQAYAQALLAVEAAAKPIISPRDADATLGKMIRAVRDAPQNFTFVLGDPMDAVPSMKAMWVSHLRHGTDDETVPLGMTQEQADAAVHLALTLVRWFAGGAFARA